MATNFNNGRTLNECINDVMSKKTTKVSKRIELIKLGLCQHEVSMLLGRVKHQTVSKNPFNFNSLTFGVEIECFNVSRVQLVSECRSNNLAIQSESYNHRDNNSYYKIVSDSSIAGENANEIVSPVLAGKNVKNSLKKICEALAACDARVNMSCGLHVHIGASSISEEHYCRIIRNYQKLELAIDSFMPLSRRANNNGYCKSLLGRNLDYCTTRNEIIRRFNSRYYKVNAEAYERHKTIEFRHHGGTTDYEKIMHWVVFLAKLVEYSYKNEITECNIIEDIPFLSESEKEFFINRRTALN